jgi:hypothetical protein
MEYKDGYVDDVRNAKPDVVTIDDNNYHVLSLA